MGYVTKTGNTYGLAEAGKSLVAEVAIKVEAAQPVEKPPVIEEALEIPKS